MIRRLFAIGCGTCEGFEVQVGFVGGPCGFVFAVGNRSYHRWRRVVVVGIVGWMQGWLTGGAGETIRVRLISCNAEVIRSLVI